MASYYLDKVTKTVIEIYGMHGRLPVSVEIPKLVFYSIFGDRTNGHSNLVCNGIVTGEEFEHGLMVYPGNVIAPVINW